MTVKMIQDLSGRKETKFEKMQEMFSEDIDMSMRIRNAGFSLTLLRSCEVFHKRRISFRKFLRQVYVFGMSRITLRQLYPGSMKLVHTLPALFLIGSVVLLALGVVLSPWFIAPLAIYLVALFFAALCSTKSLKVALLALPASLIQLYGYGAGFLKACFTGRNPEAERRIRAGKNE